MPVFWWALPRPDLAASERGGSHRDSEPHRPPPQLSPKAIWGRELNRSDFSVPFPNFSKPSFSAVGRSEIQNDQLLQQRYDLALGGYGAHLRAAVLDRHVEFAA